MANPLTPDDLASLRTDFAANPAYRITQNAVTKVGIQDVALDRSVVTGTDHSVSHLLDDWKVTNQKKSGRCWLFAGLNLLRVGAMSAMNVKDFEFSQNHIMFWDKLERANYFLNAIIETRDRDVDDRTVAHLLGSVADDGGQWNMFVSLVRKHGLVPKAVMPETQSSSETGRMNAVLRKVLREGARTLREHRRRRRRARQGAHGDPGRGAPHPRAPPRHAAGVVRLAVDRQGPQVPPRRRADAAGVRRALRRPADRGLRLPRARPARDQPVRPDVHGRVPRQRRRRPAA